MSLSRLISFFAISLVCVADPVSLETKKWQLSQSGSGLDATSKDMLNKNNADLDSLHRQLRDLYEEAKSLQAEDTEASRALLTAIQTIRAQIATCEKLWQEHASSLATQEDNLLWKQENVKLKDLILDYASASYVYLIPPALSDITISISSEIPIPRGSWDDLLLAILAQKGVGIRQLSPYLRELYLVSEQLLPLDLLTQDSKQLDSVAPESSVAFLLLADSPLATKAFFERFAATSGVTIHVQGNSVLLLGLARQVQDLLKIQHFVAAAKSQTAHRIIALDKVDAKEAESLVKLRFADEILTREEEQLATSLRVLPLQSSSKALFVSGPAPVLDKVEAFIKELEASLSESSKKRIYTYLSKHADPKALANVLEMIYNQMKGGNVESILDDSAKDAKGLAATLKRAYAGQGVKKESDEGSFVVDAKTGHIIMVLEPWCYEELMKLAAHLDVAPKMVRIDILLFEKKITDETSYGLNLLRLGDQATVGNAAGLSWNEASGGPAGSGPGILAFILGSNKSQNFPAIDLTYNFLLSQRDVKINSNPSITTLNETKGTAEVTDEISVFTGTVRTDTSTSNNFARMSYGTTIAITPTVHMDDATGDLDKSFITLKTEIAFQTIQASKDSKPDVTSRKINNEVRVGHGQTIVLGGLTAKTSEDQRDKVPFLGELPGIGKLFSTTTLRDQSTEMFIFLTPYIIPNPADELDRFRREQASRRPGDIPDFLERLNEAQEKNQRRLMEGSMRILFGS